MLPVIRSRRIYLLVFGVALAIRLASVATLPVSPETMLVEDASIYWNGSGVLLEHHVIGRETNDGLVSETERVPGYVFFQAGLRWLFGDFFLGILLAQAFLDSVTCVLIAVIGAALPSSSAPRVALVAGLLAAVTPNLVIHAGMLLTDSLFLFLFTVMLAAGAQFLKGGALRWIIVAGGALGLAIVTRSLAAPLPLLLLPIVLAVPLKRGRRILAAIAVVVAFLGTSMTPAAFWVHRNYSETGVMGLSSQNGAHMMQWIAPLVRRAHDGTPRDQGAAELHISFLKRMRQDGVDLSGMNAFAKSDAWTKYALAEISRYPVQAMIKAGAIGTAINLGAPAVLLDQRLRALPHGSFDRAEGGGLSGQVVNFLRGSAPAYIIVAVTGMIAMGLISLLQMYGLIRLAAMQPWIAALAALGISYFLVLNGPVGSPKYRLPLEPVLILLASLGLTDLWVRFQPGKKRANAGSTGFSKVV